MELMYWVWLTTVPDIGPITANRLLVSFGVPEKIFDAGNTELEELGILNKKQVSSIMQNRTLESACHMIEQCENLGISIMTKADEIYPNKAKKFEDAPILLYYKGNPGGQNATVGIVGARRCTQETKREVIRVTEEYLSEETTIISGMAKGVDSYAHTVALNNDGYTIAIVGNGLDICYPSEHVKLMQSIEEKGMILSEYPPGTKPARYSFPQRNRLISAWSDELIVIGAGRGSGALITAEYSRKYGRQVRSIQRY